MQDYSNETPEEVERQLAAAKRALQDFEDSVDSHRLLLRLKAQSPFHFVLLARFFFRAATLLCVLSALVVLVIALVNTDLARILQKFEAVMPLPSWMPEVPALPMLLGFLALLMGMAWFFSTQAARSLGRDAQMLPWEQKQYQKLVNEVTRLGTQKAVIERIRNTPAGARPRIATPVPVGTRRSGPTPAPADPRASFGRTPASSSARVASAASSLPATRMSASGQAVPSSLPVRPGGFGHGPTKRDSSANPPRESAPSAGSKALPPKPSRVEVNPEPLSARPLRESSPTEPMQRPSPSAKSSPATPQGLAVRRITVPASALGREDQLAEIEERGPAEPQAAVPSSAALSSAAQASTAQPSTAQASTAQASGAGSAPVQLSEQQTAIRSVEELSGRALGPPPSTIPTLIEPVPEAFRLRNRPPELTDGTEPPLAPSPAPPPASPAISAGPQESVAGGVRLGSNRGPTSVEPGRPAISLSLPAAASVSSTPEGPATVASVMPAPSVQVSAVQTGHGGLEEGGAQEESLRTNGESTLGRARAGEIGTTRKMPLGSAGRVRIQPTVASLQIGRAPLLGRNTRGGTPLGAPPKAGVPVGQAKPRLPVPSGFLLPTDAGSPADASATSSAPGQGDVQAGAVQTSSLGSTEDKTDIFSTDGLGSRPGEVQRSDKIEEAVVIFEDEDSQDAEDETLVVPEMAEGRRLPPLRAGAEMWLTEAMSNAEALLKTFPPEATIELSREPNLPFTLVISRAAPAVAVRATVQFVEFLSSIATPPRARIELVGVSQLDRSFHKDVEAALEPYFSENFEVRPGPGHIDIRFTDPDPLWSAYPRIPVAR